MKTFLITLVFIVGCLYYFVPNDIKNEYIAKTGLEYRFEEESKKLEPGAVRVLKFDEGNIASYSGNIKNGKAIQDLTWATSPYVKCFKKEDFSYFEGKQELHRILLEKNKTIKIDLIDKTPDKSLSIYAYKVKPGRNILPPNISMTHACVSKKALKEEKSLEIKGDTIKSEIIIAVAGPKNLAEGSYDLKITQK